MAREPLPQHHKWQPQRPFGLRRSGPISKCSRSRTIHELLKTTGQRTYKRAIIGRGLAPRMVQASTQPGLMLKYSHGGQSVTTTSRAPRLERFFGDVPIERGDGDGQDLTKG
jgi:hypothetical protein